MFFALSLCAADTGKATAGWDPAWDIFEAPIPRPLMPQKLHKNQRDRAKRAEKVRRALRTLYCTWSQWYELSVRNGVWLGGLCTPRIELASGARRSGARPYLVGASLWKIQSCDKLNRFRASNKTDCGGLKSTCLWYPIGRTLSDVVRSGAEVCVVYFLGLALFGCCIFRATFHGRYLLQERDPRSTAVLHTRYEIPGIYLV